MKAVKGIREVLAETEDKRITVGRKLSLEQCRKLLNRDGRNYSDRELLIIRDFLYTMASIDYIFFTGQYQNQHSHEQTGIPLRQGEYRRAG